MMRVRLMIVLLTIASSAMAQAGPTAQPAEPKRYVLGAYDGGYPSCVQLPDGRVVVAYYARKTSYHDRYHLGVVTWDPSTTFPVK